VKRPLLLALLLVLPGVLLAAATADQWLDRLAASGSHGPSASPALALGDRAARRHYCAQLAGTGAVAGRPTQIVAVEAPDDWRFGYRLWLDQASGRPVRVETLDADGSLVERRELLDAAPAIGPRPASGPPSKAALREAAGGWHVPSPPAGFQLRAARRDSRGIHLLYGDGVASVSVYIERGAPGLSGTSSSQQGALHAREYWVDGWRILAIGRVPDVTVDRFARTVTQAPDHG
jgi:sigma-E factor negative regulatory protein RseB